MSLVVPDSIVILCGNVPFDMNYNATKLYSSKEAQYSDISSKALFTANACRYVKGTKAIRLNVPAQIAFKSNYIIYKNTSFENKYFYAFIVAVNYINNDLFEFIFELDVIQTWMFDYVLPQCYIEREHIANDVKYASKTIEQLETGDYIVTSQWLDRYSRRNIICLEATFRRTAKEDGTYEYTVAEGGWIGNSYFGLEHYMFPSSDEGIAQLKAFIEQTNNDGRVDGITSIKMIPEKSGIKNNALTLYDSYQDVTTGDNLYKEGTPFEGYVPKNNKLYNYPYRYIKVLNGRGNAATYKWDESNVPDKSSLVFNVSIADYSGDTMLVSQYNISGGGTGVNMCDTMVYPATIACPWASDSYKAWLAQNQGQLQYLNTTRNLNVARGNIAGAALLSKAAIGGAAGILTLNSSAAIGAAGQAIDAATTAANTLINYEQETAKINAIIQDHEVLPPSACSTSTSGSGAYNSGYGGFTFQTCSIKAQYAKIIDNYFTKYGYACHEVKTPNLHTRASYNYIKTVGCTIKGYAPAQDLRRLQEIYDNGLTFWHTDLDSIGNYGLDNGSV